MPQGDGTGPMGQGPRTGRGQGPCGTGTREQGSGWLQRAGDWFRRGRASAQPGRGGRGQGGMGGRGGRR